MLFAVKIGNSSFSIFQFNNPIKNEFIPLLSEPSNNLNWNKLRKFMKDKSGDCIICSVVNHIKEHFLKLFKVHFNKILDINHRIKTDLNFLVDFPEKIGADRIACSVAALELTKESTAIVDAGTATTITVVTEKGDFLGGIIMPGLQTMNISLKEKTSLLPIVNLDETFQIPGKNTESAIRAGIILGTVYAIEGLIEEIECDIGKRLKIILTGGNASLIGKYLKIPHQLEPYLVFEGMRLIYLKNIKNF